MHIERIGFTALKGTRHTARDLVELAADGPVGDRVFCLVDPATGRVLRTVENPGLMGLVTRWDAGVLSIDLPGRTVEGEPAATGEKLEADYWGRRASLERVDGPWSSALSDHLGREVVLARSLNPGEVVYGASVTLVTTASMRLLSERLGREVSSARFRPTFLVDTGEMQPHVEDTWVGRRVRAGDAVVRVRGAVPRCAVVDVDPETGAGKSPVLGTLAGYRRDKGEVFFGVDAVVVESGTVRPGDDVELERG